MPDELFRAMHSYNSAPNSDIAGHSPHFYPHIGAGHKGIEPLMCKHNVVYDLLTLASIFLYSKKDSRSCLFWRRYFFLWGVAKTI